MDENMDMNFDDFFDAFDGEDGDQTDTPEETTEATDTADVADAAEDGDTQEDEEGDNSEENSEGESNSESAEDGAESQPEPEKAEEKRSFDNLKVNGEIRSCTYEEAPAWIQKGMDYDRVKGQLETEKQNNATIQAELDKHKETVTILENAAEESGMNIEQLLEHVQLGILMGKGMTDKEARAELRAAKAERQVKAAAQVQKEPPTKEEPAKESGDDRAQREVQEFIRDFPGVKLSDEDIAAMRPYVQKGMSMSTAYLMVEKAKLEAAAKQQAAAAAAKEKNRSNRAKSPGSQRDSGGQRTKDSADDFFAAFEK
jgi:hypothetical protein